MKEAKPILMIYFHPTVSFGGEKLTVVSIIDGLSDKFSDYHVLASPHYNEEKEPIYLQVFNDSNFTETNYEELKKLIIETLNENTNEHTTNT